MKIPYGWIREFVDLDLGPAEAADRLVNAGIEVASVTPLAPPGLAGVVVGEIEAIERELGESRGHRLRLCRVWTGRERFGVVCGAPNARVGARAAFAPPGATLPGGRRIGVAQVHGVESQGMLCSERELGLGEEHEAGLLLVDGAVRPGADLLAALGLDDQVLEVEVTPNRPDCLSVLGVARELAALTGARLTPPRVTLREGRAPARGLVRVRIEASDLCHRFTARVITDVRVGPSPAWLAQRLRAAGLRPISNVVDVTNYVLWELGHPLHAFDYERVTDATIVVRRARAGERFTTLDGQERTLTDAMLVIADPARAIGLAGVMGGANTEVGEATTRVLLESAYFQPASIRRTSRALGLRTDAAYRFERGADVEALVQASARAAGLIAELAGGTVARGVVDAYPRRRRPVRLRLRMARVRRVLGVAPTAAHARRILTGLGLPTRGRGALLDVQVPSFRRDLALEDDLVEELIRVWGYDKLPSTLSGGATVVARESDRLRQEALVRRALVGAGLVETISYTFSDPARAAVLRGPADGAAVALRNPLSQDAAALRRSPLEGVLGAVATNLRRQQPDVRVFEIGVTFEPAESETGTREPRWAVVALAGARADASWYAGEARVDAYDAKGLAEHVLAALGTPAALVGTRPGGALGGFEPDCHATVLAGDQAVAEFGEIAAAARAAFGIDVPVFAAALPLDRVPYPGPPPRHQPLPRFPAVQRDLAFVLGAGQPLTAAALEAELAREAGPLLRGLVLFDVFRFPDGRTSLAWRLVFQAEDRTLTDDEVNEVQERVARRVTERFGVTLRSA